MPGDLLRTLNAAIDSSEVYTGYKKARIEELRLRKSGARSTEDIYRINCEIISPRAGCGWRSSTPCRGFSCRPTTFSGLSTTDGCLPTRNAAITGTRSAITRT